VSSHFTLVLGHSLLDFINILVVLLVIFWKGLVPNCVSLEVRFVLSLPLEITAATPNDEEHMDHQVAENA
jgi:hypothetical protein